MSVGPVRIGLVGAGTIGREHARVAASLPGAELVGIADPQSDAAGAIAQRLRVPLVRSLDELLDGGRVDAVIIAVPTAQHFVVATQAIAAGVHVLIEKPLAGNVREAETLAAAAGTSDRTVMVGHIERFNPAVQVLKRALEDQQVISIDITRVGPRPPQVMDVGVIVDIGVHDIDLVRFLTGAEFVETYAVKSHVQGVHEDTAQLMFRMSNNTLAHITVNWLTPFKAREISVVTPNRLIRADLIAQRVVEYSDYNWELNAYQVREHRVANREPLRAELEEFVAAIRERRPPSVTVADGLEAVRTALSAGRDAAREGRR